MVFKLPFAVPVAVHVYPQRGIADLVQCTGYAHNMPFLHMPGKSMNHNHQGAFV